MTDTIPPETSSFSTGGVEILTRSSSTIGLAAFTWGRSRVLSQTNKFSRLVYSHSPATANIRLQLGHKKRPTLSVNEISSREATLILVTTAVWSLSPRTSSTGRYRRTPWRPAAWRGLVSWRITWTGRWTSQSTRTRRRPSIQVLYSNTVLCCTKLYSTVLYNSV